MRKYLMDDRKLGAGVYLGGEGEKETLRTTITLLIHISTIKKHQS